MRRAAVLALCAAIGLSLLTSSSGFAQETTITWLYPGGEQPVSRETWQGQLDHLAEVHPEIDVDVIAVPWDLAHDRIVSMILAGDPPDLVQMGSRWIPEFVEMGAIMPLDDYFGPEKTSIYYPGLLETVQYKGSLYALPRAYSTQALIYRTDLISDPPNSWDELMRVAREVQENHPNTYGFGFGGADHVSTLSQYFTILFTFGGEVFDAEGRLRLESPEAVEALKVMKQLVDEELVPNPIEYHREELPNLFRAGRIAMFISGPWGGNSTGLPPDNDEIPYASAPVPAGPVGTGTELVSDSTAISSATSNLDAALTFLDFITEPDEQAYRDRVGGLVPQGPEIAKRPEFQESSYFQTFIDMADYGSPQPQPTVWEPFQDVIVEMVQSALLGLKTPEQAVSDAAARLLREGLVPTP